MNSKPPRRPGTGPGKSSKNPETRVKPAALGTAGRVSPRCVRQRSSFVDFPAFLVASHGFPLPTTDRFWDEPSRETVFALRCPHAVRRLAQMWRQPLRFLRFLLFFGLAPSVRTPRDSGYPAIRPLHPVEVEDAQIPRYIRQLPIAPQLENRMPGPCLDPAGNPWKPRILGTPSKRRRRSILSCTPCPEGTCFELECAAGKVVDIDETGKRTMNSRKPEL